MFSRDSGRASYRRTGGMLAPLVRTLPASFIHAEVVRVSGAFVLK
jgi:hypothetical protein